MIGLQPAQDIFHWVENSILPTANEWATPEMPTHFFKYDVPYRTSHIMDFYFSLQYIGTRTDVQFDVVHALFHSLKEELCAMDQDSIEHLCTSVKRARRMLEDSGRDPVTDPVLRLIAQEFGNGILKNLFMDMEAMWRALMRKGQSSGLNDLLKHVADPPHPIREIVPTQAVFPLLTRLRFAGTSMPGVYSIEPGIGEFALVKSDVFRGEGTEPTERQLNLWSRISMEYRHHMDVWVAVVGVDAGGIGRDGDGDEDMSGSMMGTRTRFADMNFDDIEAGLYKMFLIFKGMGLQ